MAFESPVFVWSFPAAADYSAAANAYKFVKLNTDGAAEICSAITDQPIGILQNLPNPAKGQRAEVMILGISKVNADAALTVGQKIGTSADGQAAAYVHGTATTVYICGTVLGAAGGAGEKATAIIDCVHPNRGA